MVNPSTALLAARRPAATQAPPSSTPQDARVDFLSEAKLTLKHIQEDCQALDDGAGLARLGVLFRNVHTFKSLMSFAGMEAPGRFAAEFEQYLADIWRGRLPFDSAAADLVRRGVTSLGPLDSPLATSHPDSISTPIGAELRSALDTAAEIERIGRLTTPTEGASASTTATATVPSERTIQVGIRELGDIEALADNAMRLLNRLHDVTADARDERTQMLVVAIQRNIEQMRQRVHQHRFTSLRGFFLPMTAIVQEMAARHGKRAGVRLQVENVEVEKATLEALRSAVVHLLRNAVSHGLETPEDRALAGKPEEGAITVTAEMHDNCLRITIRDDGTGLDSAALCKAAVRMGALSPERAALTDHQQARLLAFVPGLSTCAIQDDLSGNGMGLAAVAESLACLSGHVSIESQPGQGTTFILQVPLP